MTASISPAMIKALNEIGITGQVTGVRVATLNALVSRGLGWDEDGVWYLTSEAHDMFEVSDEARAADMARQEAQFIAEVARIDEKLSRDENQPSGDDRLSANDQRSDEPDFYADADDLAVDEPVRGDVVMSQWLDLPEAQRSASIQEQFERMQEVASPLREYQTAQEALDVLAAIEAELDEQAIYPFDMTPPEADPLGLAKDDECHADGEIPAPDDLGQRDPNEGIEEWHEFMAAQELAESLPQTEVDVAAAGARGLAQIGKRVVEVDLIAVVNRRTAFSDTLLATVEFEGTRRLVSANDFVAEWSA